MSPPLYSVSCEIKKEEKNPLKVVIQICQNLTLFHLKNALSAKLKTPKNQLRLKEVNKKIVLNEKYDRESISDKGYIVEILPSKLRMQDMPSYNISNQPSINNKLIEYMRLDEDFAEEIWKLMKDFPTNRDIYTKLSGLNLIVNKDAYKAWNAFLEIDGHIHSILYNIHEIKKMFKRSDDSEEYLIKFILKEGFTYLRLCYKESLNVPTNGCSYSTIRLIKYLMEAMTIILKSYNDNNITYIENPQLK